MNGAHCVGALAYLQHTLQGFQLIVNHGHVNRAVKLYNVYYLFTLSDDQETLCGTSKGDFSTKGIPGLSLIFNTQNVNSHDSAWVRLLLWYGVICRQDTFSSLYKLGD